MSVKDIFKQFKPKPELEQERDKLVESLNLNNVERKSVALLSRYLEVLFAELPEHSQSKVLKVMYDFQLVKERTIRDVYSAEGKGKETPQ